MSTSAFAAGEPVVLFDRKFRKYLAFLEPGKKIHIHAGMFEPEELMGKEPGARVRTNKGHSVAAYRPTLDEYVLLMKRSATVVPPKDTAMLVAWGDVAPGMTVVEAGMGSGGLTLGLLRAVGDRGRVIGVELREDHLNRATKNISAWLRELPANLEVHRGDVVEVLEAVRDADRVILDLGEPWVALAGAGRALKPGGALLAYCTNVRQLDRLVLALMDQMEFSIPDVIEVIVRPWVADRLRLRPAQRMVGHTGFLLRARRRGEALVDPHEITIRLPDRGMAPSGEAPAALPEDGVDADERFDVDTGET